MIVLFNIKFFYHLPPSLKARQLWYVCLSIDVDVTSATKMMT